MHDRRAAALIRRSVVQCLMFLLLVAGARGADSRPGDHWGERYQAPSPIDGAASLGGHLGHDAVRRWNAVLLDANAADHGLSAPDQLGPVRTARAFAIVHIAIFDAVNAIAGGYRGYATQGSVSAPTSMDAAVAQAAHDALVALYPAQAGKFDRQLQSDLKHLANGAAKLNGVALGAGCAAAILALRASDSVQLSEEIYGVEYLPAAGANKWRQDPISAINIALGSRWDERVAPFVLTAAGQFPLPAPPAAGSAEFLAAFDEVKNYGGCGSAPSADCALAFGGAATPTVRTAEQAQIGVFWGYDGTPGLGTPPRLYNQIAVQIAQQRGTGPVELARLLALINVAMADAGLAAWQAKYDHEFGRPITVIREASVADGGDPSWTPLGAPASNKIGPNFTPPFPAYASGHATFGAALFQTLRQFYGSDQIHFTFVSDEFNGVTKDNNGVVRPRLPRHFSSLTQAEEENGQSRIYLGIHWAFDKTAGIAQGRQVADYVLGNVFTPLE